MSQQINRLIKFSQDLFFVWVLIGVAWGYFFPKIAASGIGNISTALGVVMLGMGLTITTQQLHSLRNAGLILGYFGAAITGKSTAVCRTISIEVAMQNSGLAVALALANFEPAAAIPGAIFSVCHNLTGSLIAAIWRKNL
ncbi:MAG: hypothetical protein KME64_21530 [Scytonematopsis contorta HA4267-MV1]|jgi:predicted Na+-dependent transporter|nr:hypothetical protein [Scytonematopsis contorta HA4267-MV1]